MAELSFFIENKLIPPPLDWENTTIELSFQNNAPDATVKTTTFEWLGEDAAFLFNWFKNGLTGGLGIFEGPAFRIEACGLIVFDGCINMTSEETTFQCDIVKASVKETNRIQFLRDRASGINFSQLAATIDRGGAGTITNVDYIAVPYVISRIPDAVEVAILSISFVQLVKIFKDGIQTLKDLADKAIADTATITAAILAGSPGGVIVATAIFIVDGILALAYALYLIFIASLAIAVFLLIINNIIQPLKYKFGMRVRDLFQKGCQALGMEFSSTLLTDPSSPYYNMVIIPKKNSKLNGFRKNDQDLSGIVRLFDFLTLNITIPKRKQYDDALNTVNTDPLDNAYGYYEGTFAQLIKDMEDVFNIVDPVSGQSGLVIRDNTLHFEQWNYWKNESSFTMPPQSSDAPFPDPYGTNASEISSNYFLVFNQDTSDANTYDQYDGTSCMATFQPITVVDQKKVLLKNLTQINLNFALAKRKTELTIPEAVVNVFLDIIILIYDIILIAISKLTSKNISLVPSDPISNSRIGAMLLSSDFTSVPKLLIVEDPSGSTHGISICKIKSDNQLYVNATTLAKSYHSSSWLINGDDHNQYLKFKDKEIPVCCLDFINLRNNNIINSVDGNKGRVDTIAWNPHIETAKIDFRVKERYTTNVKSTIIIDGQ